MKLEDMKTSYIKMTHSEQLDLVSIIREERNKGRMKAKLPRSSSKAKKSPLSKLNKAEKAALILEFLNSMEDRNGD